MAAPVSDKMKGLIRSELDRIAHDEDVRILFAIESGSRAWGFHSTDSDYDVRFVYARSPDWFLRLDDRRDVIERPISGDLDISGWDLGKALKLALKSNAVLSEWLQSPIRYADEPEARQRMMDFCRRALTRRPVTWHYLSLAEQQRAGVATDNGIKLKRYFYVLRPVMALRWMRLHDAATPPMNLWELIAAADVPPTIQTYLKDLVQVKLETGEMGFAEKTDPAADAFIEDELQATRDWLARQDDHRPADLWAEANALHIDITKRFA